MNALFPLVAAVAALTLSQADDDEAKVAPDEVPAGATLTGRITFKGEVPEAVPLKISVKQASGCCPDGVLVDATNRELLVDAEGGIADVVVTLTVPGVKVELPEEPVELDQHGCRFEPHVMIVPKGAKIAFLNSDDTSHNVHLVNVLNQPLNQTVIAHKRLEYVAAEAERMKLVCDLHTWMHAWIVVTDATHWAKTAPDGTFSIAGLPPGKHEATVWHEKLGRRTVEVTVSDAGEVEPLALELEPKKKKKPRRRR